MGVCGGGLTEHAQTVVHGNHDDVAVGREDAGVEHVPRALHVGASVDKQHHRLLPAVTDIWRGGGGGKHTHKHAHTQTHTQTQAHT